MARMRRLAQAGKKLLWWGCSAVVHVIALWILAHWTYSARSAERSLPPVVVDFQKEVVLPPIDTGYQEPAPEPSPDDVKIDEPTLVEPELNDPAVTETQKERLPRVFAVNVKGGAFAHRGATGRGLALRGGGANAGSENAVNQGLLWLARKQLVTGSWRADRPGYRWADPGLTGLATLAFQGAGHTHVRSGPFRRNVNKALAYIKARQDAEGCIAFKHEGRRVGHTMYNHAICTLALTEGYGMTKDPLLREPTQRAVDFIVERQNSTGGWRYYPHSSDADTSVAGWMIMALHSAKLAGIQVPEKAYDGARKFLATVSHTDPKSKYFGVTSYLPTIAPSSPALIAVGLLCNQYLGMDRDDPFITRAGKLIEKFPPKWVDTRNAVDLQNLPSLKPGANAYYFWYYANLALFQRRGEAWDKWHPQVRDLLAKVQVTTGREQGSWPPDSRWARTGGRVYATAMAILTLEVYYRYAPLYKNVVDPVLAAYGHALIAYAQFARLANDESPDAPNARKQAIAKFEHFLRLSSPKSGTRLERPTRHRRGKAVLFLTDLHRHAGRFDETLDLIHAVPQHLPELFKNPHSKESQALLKAIPKGFWRLLIEPRRSRTIADLHYVHSRRLAEAGKKQDAKDALGRAIDLYHPLALAYPDTNAPLEHWTAERLFETGDWDRAVELYKQRARRLAAHKSQDNKAARAGNCRRIISCYANLRRFTDAGRWLERLAGLLGESHALQRERAYLLFRSGRYAQAGSIYASILRRLKQPNTKYWQDPNYWEAIHDRLSMMLHEDRHADVVRHIEYLEGRRPTLGGPQSRKRLLALLERARQGS